MPRVTTGTVDKLLKEQPPPVHRRKSSQSQPSSAPQPISSFTTTSHYSEETSYLIHTEALGNDEDLSTHTRANAHVSHKPARFLYFRVKKSAEPSSSQSTLPSAICFHKTLPLTTKSTTDIAIARSRHTNTTNIKAPLLWSCTQS